MNAVLTAGLVLLAVLAACAAARRYRRGGGCCGEHEEAVRRNAAADRNKSHYPYEAALEIGGMTCENCARRVENALNELDGVWAKVSISTRKAKVLCKTEPDETALRTAVRGAGYVVTSCRTGKVSGA